MSDPAVSELINQVSQRVSALEGNPYKFVVPVVLSSIAILVSIATALMTRHVSIKNMRHVTLQGIKGNIDSAKSQVESVAMQIAPLKAKIRLTQAQQEELNIKNQVLDSVIERLLNAYNDGCQKFHKGQVVEQDFIDLYHQDIADYIKVFKEKFSGPLTRFDAMLKYFNEKHKNPKA